jgi:hypothetical protein
MRWALWWFALLTAYVVEFVVQTGGEVATGAMIAALATIVVAGALLDAEPPIRVRWSWLRHLARVPGAMLRDVFTVSARIVWSLQTREPLVGRIVRVPYDPGDRADAFEQGREALAIFGVSAAPNTVVADVDLRGSLVVHQLVARDDPHESDCWPL